MKKRLALYLTLTFCITWGVSLLLFFTGAGDAVVSMVLSALMLVPAFCVIVTRLATGEGVRELYLRPNFQDNFLFYLSAWFLPSVVITVGMLLYFMVFPSNFDADFTGMIQIMEAQGNDMSVINIEAVFYSLMVNNIFIAPLINAVLALGEELGWRGYLLPKLCEKMPSWKAVLLAGAAWGLCKAPMALLGFNYGTDYGSFPWGGMLAQFLFCVVVGVFFGFLTVRVGSALPAALCSGAVTAFMPTGAYLALDGGNPLVGPTPTGILGGAGFLIVAAVCLYWLVRGPKKQKEEIRLLRTKFR